MGSEFIDRATKSFVKSMDRARIKLATADLFTRAPDRCARTAAAEMFANVNLSSGEHVTIEERGNSLLARRGITSVAKFIDPAPEIVQAIRDSCGIATGVVEQVHEFSGVVEISIC